MNSTTLMAAMPCSRANAEKFADPLTDAMAKAHIDTPDRQAAFLAQIAHESGSLTYVQELASGDAYEGRKDLGNFRQGDGRRYKGHGLLQVTGRLNHQNMHGELVRLGYENVPDFEVDPMKLTEPVWAAASAAAFWNANYLNKLCDGSLTGFDAVSKRINGGTNGLLERRALWARAKKALGIV